MIGYAIALTSLIAAFCFPPLALFLYMLFSWQEAWGMGLGTIGAGVPSYTLALAASIAGVMSLVRLWSNKNLDANHQRLFVLGALAMATILWMGVSYCVGGGSLRGCLELMSRSGIYAVIVTAAYFNNPWARRLFVAIVFIHVGLSFLIFTMPDGPWGRVKSLGQMHMDKNSVGGTELMQGEYRKDMAQFSNPTQTCFHAMVGLFLGVWFVRSLRPLLMGIGFCAAIAGVLVAANTVMRGVILGAVVAGGIVIFRSALKSWLRLVFFLAVVGLSIMFAGQAVSRSAEKWVDTAVGSYFLNLDASMEYRVQAIFNVIPVILTHPVFGIGSLENFGITESAFPHQSPFAGATLYGLPVGCAAALFLWWGVCATFRLKQRTENSGGGGRSCLLEQVTNDMSLLIALGWLVAALNLSNGSYLSPGGALGWICAGAACLPWAVRSKAPRQVGTLESESYGRDRGQTTLRQGKSPS
jgi:hypothetical protein